MTSRQLHLAVWRWHFLAGLYVVPFLIMLAVTGLMMMYGEYYDEWRLSDRKVVATSDSSFSASEQLAVVQGSYLHHQVDTYRPPIAAGRASEFVLSSIHGDMAGGDHSEHALMTVYVDPYTNTVTGEADPEATLYVWANTVHGTLLIGVVGDWMIEIAAGLAVLLILSGFYLWWPRGSRSWRQTLLPSLASAAGIRSKWRSLHGSIGWWTSVVLLFFLVSGLSWTSVWGGLVQGFSYIPPEQYVDAQVANAEAVPAGGGADRVPVSHENHAALNTGSLHEVPWALEQTPLPLSKVPSAAPDSAPDLDWVVAYARDNGFENFRVHVPNSTDAAWTIARSTLAKDDTNPLADRMLHLDRYSGEVLQELSFKDYPAMGKFMAAGVPLHQGDVTVVNLIFNTVFCLAVIMMCIAGYVMWWRRRPGMTSRLAPPPLPSNRRVWQFVGLSAFVLAVFVPLSLVFLVLAVLLEWLMGSFRKTGAGESAA